MSTLLLIAVNTFREGLRKRALLSVVVACFFILCFSLFLGQLSLDETARLMINFGLAALQISLLCLAIFLGNYFISGDLEKQTLLTVLARPLRPFLFFLGRYVGLSLILFVSLVLLSVLLNLFFMYLELPIAFSFIAALWGLYLESLLILAFVLFFSSYSNSFLVLVYSVSMFFVGHFIDSLKYFIEQKNPMAGKITYLFPNLERINWKSSVVYGDVIPITEVLLSSLYIGCWIGFILSLGFLFLEKKDFI